MAFDQSFLLALLLLIIGSGLLKGNISAQVGSVYPPDDEERRTRGFAIFSTGINFGAVAGPLLCGFLGERYGWHIGFGAAALFMLGALATYLSGYRYLPARVERKVASGGSAADPTRPQDRCGAAREHGDHRVPAHRLLSAGQRAARVARAARRPWTPTGSRSRSLVSVDRSRWSASSRFPLCSRCGAGRTRPAAGNRRSCGRSVPGRFICGGANLILVAAIALVARPSAVDLALALLRDPGRRLHVLLADAARRWSRARRRPRSTRR